MTDRWRDQAACRNHPPALWYPDLEHGDNHGTQASTICATCPVRTQCLTEAILNREIYGIHGGAGEDERRWLRRIYNTDGPNGPNWKQALQYHFAVLDGAKLKPKNRNGPGAICGKGVTYSRGCRCDACTLRAAMRGAAAKVDKPAARSRKRTAA